MLPIPFNMPMRSFLFCLGAALVMLVSGANAAPTVNVPAGIDPAPYDALLRRYVDERGLVNYAAWKANADDLRALDDYVAAFAKTGGPSAQGDEEVASLINAYNAITILWILQNYPTESIRELKDSWSAARWEIGGRYVSLDDIEHKNLRPLIGWKVHALVVCAARSCPPLLNTAYTAENLSALTERAHRLWLGREDLNQFDAGTGVVRLSNIFKWYAGDFKGEGDLARVLEAYAPGRHLGFLKRRAYSVRYLDYHWGLNDQGERGRDYRPGLLRRLF